MRDGTVLVTGADGFIGSHLVEALVREGYQVRALAYYNAFGQWGWLDTLPRDVLESAEVVLGDVRDSDQMRTVVKGVSGVLHLAALIGIPYSYHAPASYVATNVTGTINILQAARDLGVEKIIHTSTSEVYGTARRVPIDEEHLLHGQSPYSASKIGADQFAISYHRSFELPVGIVRPFNTYGPRQSTRAVIPTVIVEILSGRRELQLGNLTPTRDFTFVKDTAHGFIQALRSDSVIGEVVNIGSGFEISVADTVKLIAEVMGAKVTVTKDHNRVRAQNSEVERLWANTERAQRLIGWDPEFAGLEGFRRGVTITCEWFSNEANRTRYREGRYQV